MKRSTVAIISISIAALTIGMVLSAFMLSRFMLKIQRTTEKSITVKGVAEKTVKSDIAAFNCSISVKNKNKAEGYAALNKASQILCAKLDSLGFTADVREDESIYCADIYRTITTKERGKEIKENIFDHYYLTYSVRVRTNKVDVVAKNILKIHELAMRKLDVSITAPQYFISNPEQYKLELVNAASASAAERARTAARQSGSDLGPLMTARQGVIQITRSASNDTSDYGMYDTTSIQKVIRLVMTMEFALK
ncbi:MAG: SIMPL domain-containing protein [Lentisphaeria bacterium]|nr:SIMPL domain-containing protein [Lentisphaeria bacterium]MBR7144312.1 SIMPL domain-containing protein [Lentisphaeria bacterium]